MTDNQKLIVFGVFVIGLIILIISSRTGSQNGQNNKKVELDEKLKQTKCPGSFKLINKVSTKQQNQNTFLEVFGCHCGPCRAQLPNLKQLQQNNKNFYFVSITTESEGNCAEFIQQNPICKDLNVGYDEDHSVGQLMRDFRQNGVPHCFIFNKQNQLVWHGHPGQSDQIVKQLNGSNDEWKDTKGHKL